MIRGTAPAGEVSPEQVDAGEAGDAIAEKIAGENNPFVGSVEAESPDEAARLAINENGDRFSVVDEVWVTPSGGGDTHVYGPDGELIRVDESSE